MSVLQSTQNLGQIPETMLITLWAKAEEIKRPNPLLKDEKAVEILEQVDYDFTKFKKSVMSQVGVCIRASLIDKEANEFIKKNPDAVAADDLVEQEFGIAVDVQRFFQFPQIGRAHV